MIKAKNIHKSFGELEVLKGVDLDIQKGEIVSIVGPSGAGKTTLLQILGTLDKPNAGEVLVDDIDFSKLGEKELAAFRNKHIGFIFQFHQLLPEFTALENVMIVARALINDPSLILADEPSGSLDTKNKEELHKLLFDLRDKFGLTIVIVTHDKELAALSDRVIQMRDGQIIHNS